MVVPSGLPYGRSLVPYGCGELLAGDALAALDADEVFSAFVLARAGLDRDRWGPQPWVVGDSTLEATAVRTRHGRWQVRVEGHDAPAPLAVIYAAAVSGTFHWLGKGEFSRWKRRALLEAGLVPEPAIDFAALRDDAPEAMRELWASIELLVRVRVLGGEAATDSQPLSRPFLTRWAAMSEGRVRSGMEALEREHFVWRVDEHVKQGGQRPLILWRVRLEGEEPPA